MNNKLWGGRFEKAADGLLDDFNSSIGFDCRLYKYDIEGSVAHAKMLGKCGIITENEAGLIEQTLLEILSGIESGKVSFSVEAEDIHMNIEALLIERIGEVGKKLHTGRSRNDQVALDMRMYVKDEISKISGLLIDLMKTIKTLGENNIDAVMPGYTHMQKAQPISAAHQLMAYFWMFRRDYARLADCRERCDVCPLGAGALAGTTYPIDREFTAETLGFSSVAENSIDAVSDRDFVLEFAFGLSMIMMHLSRFAEEIIIWNTNEFGFVELDDAYSTGSSIMPQKKNPDVAELARGKTGRVYGNLTALLTMMKGLPLAYNKDMQEDKEQIFDSVDTVSVCLPIFTKMIATMKINSGKMEYEAGRGFTNATDLADYLTKRGLPFRDAHRVTGEIVAYALSVEKSLDDLTIGEYKKFSDIFDDDVFDAISLITCIDGRRVTGGTAREEVKKQILKAGEFINANTN